ncbi:MAG: hypothetical protein V1492_02555 [Candidatus Micrarchaeota archaeon]
MSDKIELSTLKSKKKVDDSAKGKDYKINIIGTLIAERVVTLEEAKK